MKTCRTCFFCVPNYKGGMSRFYQGTCYQANRLVLADMAACSIHKERNENMVVKSTPEKRNTYKDKDGNSMLGMTLPEVVDKILTVIAKREYTWGKYSGLAVKVANTAGKYAVVEITAKTPIKALNDPKLPKPPYDAQFVQKTSANKRKYYTIEVINGRENGAQEKETELPF